MNDFALELSKVDELILLPIYPAREEPMEGITSEALLEMCTLNNKKVLLPNNAVSLLSERTEGVILTIGAGDIDRIVLPLKEILSR
jgi:UDP-N-acetylmuramate--alanine ligase